MIQQKIILLGCCLLLLLDIGYTFFQHFTKELDGDLVPIVLYADQYEDLQGDPFGWQVLSSGKSYGGVNRFFVHWWISNYFKTVPLLFQKFVSPVESVFYASALMKTSIHLLLIVILSLLVSGSRKLFTKETLIAAMIIVPLFQTEGPFYRYIGVVFQSITYSSFYPLPLLLLLWFFKPYYDHLKGRRIKSGFFQKVTLFALVIILPFSGPLIPGIVLVAFALLIYAYLKYYFDFAENNPITIFPLSLKLFFGIIVLLSVYSVFLGQYNVEGSQHSVSLYERYLRLPRGLFHTLTQN